jgi:NAD(P)-dependent dehydrogenase (short-subunit alcohol dehydrogenase family)
VSNGENQSTPLGAAARRFDLTDRGIVVTGASKGIGRELTILLAETGAEPRMRAAVLGKIPVGQFALTNDVAGAIIHLASDAGRMVAGTILVVDGGWTSQ